MDGNDSQRLPSFQGPRDLKLSMPASRVAAPARRTFQPNLRAAPRERNRASEGNKGQAEPGPSTPAKPGPSGSHRAREGRKREPPQLVQTTGAFSEGIGSSSISLKNRSAVSTSSGGGGVSSLKRLTSAGGGDRKKEIKSERKEVKSEHERGFISDLPQKGEEEYLAPMTIPFVPEEAEEEDRKFTMEVDTLLKTSDTSIADILAKNGEEGTAILLQLPEHFPLLLDENEDTKGGQVLAAGIKDFPAGLLGNTEVLANGLARLTIGNNTFAIEPGTHPSFYQELVYVTEDSMVSLGPVRQKFLCSPDVDSFLSQS